MRKSTKAISLVLMGTAASLLGYEAITPFHHQPPQSVGSNFDEDVELSDPPTTQPHGSSYRSHSTSHYHSSTYFGGSSSNFSSGSHSFGSSSTSSGSHSGTSRGGFGGTGHAASS